MLFGSVILFAAGCGVLYPFHKALSQTASITHVPKVDRGECMVFLQRINQSVLHHIISVKPLSLIRLPAMTYDPALMVGEYIFVANFYNVLIALNFDNVCS